MITAVDTSVLLDVLGADLAFGRRSAQAIRDAISHGSLIACEIVSAEVGGRFDEPEEVTRVLGLLTVGSSAMEVAEALDAGRAWRAYRRRGGRRERVIADFLIGAHARARADSSPATVASFAAPSPTSSWWIPPRPDGTAIPPLRPSAARRAPSTRSARA